MRKRRPSVSFRKQSSLHKTRRTRRAIVETLEDRRLLVSNFQNPLWTLDVDDDGFVAPIDALLVINVLNSVGPHALNPLIDPPTYVDSDGDAFVAPIDALLVINHL